MRAHHGVIVACCLAVATLAPGAARAQQPNMAHVHMGHVLDGFKDTPNGMGLLPTAVAEAKIAADHAGYAAKDLTDLANMKRHTLHVMNAVDPTVEPKGPGLGYGVKKAAAGVAQHIEAAAKSEGASDNVKTHAVHVASAARNTVVRADQIIALGKRIEAATTAAEAAPLVTQMKELADELYAGKDANGDGKIGWQEGEGGLQTAEQHMGFMKKGEGTS